VNTVTIELLILDHSFIGSGYELLKNISIKISLHFPQIWEMCLLFRNWSMTHVHDPFMVTIYFNKFKKV